MLLNADIVDLNLLASFRIMNCSSLSLLFLLDRATSDGSVIPMAIAKSSSSTGIVLLYSHANAEDISQLFVFTGIVAY